MALVPWCPTHPNTNINVPTGPRTKSEHGKHRSPMHQAGDLTTHWTPTMGNDDNQNAIVQPLHGLQTLSDDADVPIHGWQGSSGDRCAWTRARWLSPKHEFRLWSVRGSRLVHSPRLANVRMSSVLSGQSPSLHPHSCTRLPPLSLYGTSISPLLEGRTTPPINQIRHPLVARVYHKLLLSHRRRPVVV